MTLLSDERRELDALVAEKIFGAAWNPVPTKEESGLDFREVAWLQKSPLAVSDRVTITPILARREADGGIAVLLDCPAYSTDISDAWKVVEKMREIAPPRFQNIAFVAYSYNRTYATFDAEAFYDYAPETWVEANGENATPLAICLAALQCAEKR